MSGERLQELWSRFLANEPLSVDEEQILLIALKADPSLRRELLEEARIDGRLGVRASNLRDSEAPIRRFLKRIGAEKDATGFIKKMKSRLEREGPPEASLPDRASGGATRRATGRGTSRGTSPRVPSGWNFGLFPAGMALGIVALIFLISGLGGSRVSWTARQTTKPPAPGSPENAMRPTDVEGRRAESARLEAEATLREIEQERLKLIERPPAREGIDSTKNDDLKKAIAELEERKKRTEDELKEAVERGKRSAVVPSEGMPARPSKDPFPVPGTEAAVATLERVEGEVLLAGKDGKIPGRPDQVIRAGQRMETGAKSFASLKYPDGTRIEMGETTILAELTEGSKRLVMLKGTLHAQVAKQPKEQPMIIATAHGEARVVGTTLNVLVDPDPSKGMRLEVEEGKVELKNLAGKTVLVESGHYAVAAAGVELASKQFPVDQVVLFPTAGKSAGNEWRAVKDDKALRGLAWETNSISPSAPQATLLRDYTSSVGRVNNRTASYVEFRFVADADKDYCVWVRALCLVTTSTAGFCDQVAIEVPGGRVSRTDPAFKDNPAIALINGHALRPKYWWVGGDADMTGNATPDTPTDDPPVTVRFARTGPQILRVFSLATFARVDAILLSTIHKTRPEDGFAPSGVDRK
ncbi:MAG TPA: FecR family protein [Planctomycetota bacterium]|nr:FecR family protein [Planctomycetota bacterium]